LLSRHLDRAHVNDTANAVASVHVVEGLVDLAEWLSMRDELVDLELVVHVILDETTHLAAALDTAECTTLPYTTGDELECWRRKK